MRNVSDKTCRENQKFILCSLIVFPENHAVYEVVWESMVEPDIP
jgi:hypothetical protein